MASLVEGIKELGRLCQLGIHIAMLIDIEITCDHKWCIATHFLYLLQEKACALHSCFLTLMIKVEIEDVEFPLGGLVLQICPCTDAWQGCVPSLGTNHIGSFGEPECAMIDTPYTALLVENGGILALGSTIVTTNTNVVIILQTLAQILQLSVQDFLHGQYIPRFIVGQGCDTGHSLGPCIAHPGITRIGITDIVSTHGNALSCHA